MSDRSGKGEDCLIYFNFFSAACRRNGALPPLSAPVPPRGCPRPPPLDALLSAGPAAAGLHRPPAPQSSAPGAAPAPLIYAFVASPEKRPLFLPFSLCLQPPPDRLGALLRPLRPRPPPPRGQSGGRPPLSAAGGAAGGQCPAGRPARPAAPARSGSAFCERPRCQPGSAE